MSRTDFFAALRNSKDAFKEGRSGRQGRSLIEAPNGDYVVRFQSADLDLDRDGAPVVLINTIVVHGEDQDSFGKRIAQRTVIKERRGINKNDTKYGKAGEEWVIPESRAFGDVCQVLQSFSVDTESMELVDLGDVVDQLAEDQPACRVTVGTKQNGYSYVKWGTPVTDTEDLLEISDVTEESPASEDDEDDDDDDDDEEDDSSVLVEPEKGETLTAQPDGTKSAEDYEVMTVNRTKEECTLKRVRDGRMYRKQPWGVIKA